MHEKAIAGQATRSFLTIYERAVANSTAQFQRNINALNAIGTSIQANNAKSMDTAARTAQSYLDFASSAAQLSLRCMGLGREAARKAATIGETRNLTCFKEQTLMKRFSDQMNQFNKALTHSASEMMESALTAAPKTPKTNVRPSAPAASETETEH